jgi:23S rRNA (uracil1939-C5)-methyltransferase
MTEFETTITSVGHDGRGVARIDGKAMFVSGALTGETVLARMRRQHRNYDEAEAVQILVPSPNRVLPRCPHFGTCGGCSLQHMAPAAQIAMKQQILADNLERIGKVKPASWLPPLADNPWNYRRKGRFSVRYVAKKERVLVGFREDANPRFVADIHTCDVIHPALSLKVGLLADLISAMDVRARQRGAGSLRQAAWPGYLPAAGRQQQRASVMARGTGAALCRAGRQHRI